MLVRKISKGAIALMLDVAVYIFINVMTYFECFLVRPKDMKISLFIIAKKEQDSKNSDFFRL